MDLPVGSNELLKYFESVSREYPSTHMSNGVQMCRRWIAMQNQAEVLQAEIDDFAGRLEREPDCGTGWLDLGLQFRHWARLNGFRA